MKEEVIAYLKQCAGGELSDILRQVFAVRPETEPEGTAFEYRMVLGLAARENIAEKENDVRWGQWQIVLVGYLDPSVYSPDWEFWGEPFVQYGECIRCRVEICSHVKTALCPLCGSQVQLT